MRRDKGKGNPLNQLAVLGGLAAIVAAPKIGLKTKSLVKLKKSISNKEIRRLRKLMKTEKLSNKEVRSLSKKHKVDIDNGEINTVLHSGKEFVKDPFNTKDVAMGQRVRSVIGDHFNWKNGRVITGRRPSRVVLGHEIGHSRTNKIRKALVGNNESLHSSMRNLEAKYLPTRYLEERAAWRLSPLKGKSSRELKRLALKSYRGMRNQDAAQAAGLFGAAGLGTLGVIGGVKNDRY